MVAIILKSDLFKIYEIEVVGNNKVDREDIIHYSALHKGENIFRIRPKVSKANIERLPYINEAKIKRKFPKTIIVDVTEREEKALIKTISMYHVIDIEGYLLKQVDAEDEKLPTLLGLQIENPKLGINVFEDIKIDNLMDFLLEGNRLQLLGIMKTIDLEELDNINISLNNGIDIDFGTMDNVKYKLRLLNEVLVDIEKKDTKANKILMNKGEHPIIIIDD